MQKHSHSIFSTCVMNLPVFNKELDSKLVFTRKNKVYFFYKNGFRMITDNSDEFADYSKLN
ncbi:MAG: hypothetical protein ABFD00_00820 [Chloroherpetonaceae bacterium]